MKFDIKKWQNKYLNEGVFDFGTGGKLDPSALSKAYKKDKKMFGKDSDKKEKFFQPDNNENDGERFPHIVDYLEASENCKGEECEEVVKKHLLGKNRQYTEEFIEELENALEIK